MKDLMLKFKNKKEMEQVLSAQGFIKDENGILNHDSMLLDIIGTLYDFIEDEPENSSLLSATVGYHANIRVLDDDIDLSALNKFTITDVNTPSRVWASMEKLHG